MVQCLTGLCVSVEAEDLPVLEIFSRHARDAYKESSPTPAPPPSAERCRSAAPWSCSAPHGHAPLPSPCHTYRAFSTAAIAVASAPETLSGSNGSSNPASTPRGMPATQYECNKQSWSAAIGANGATNQRDASERPGRRARSPCPSPPPCGSSPGARTAAAPRASRTRAPPSPALRRPSPIWLFETLCSNCIVV